MLINIDPAQFEKGFEAGLNKVAYGWTDFKYNLSHPIDSFNNAAESWGKERIANMSKDPAVNNMLQDKANTAGQSFTSGALSGVQKSIGYDPNKGFGDNAMGMIKQHPIMAGLAGAGTLFGGYQLGKGMGLWGNDAGGQQQQHDDNEALPPAPGPKNGFSAAYTTGAMKAPQALQKAGSSFNMADGVRMNVSDLTLPRAFSAPTAIGMNLVSMMADEPQQEQQEQQQTPTALNIAGQDPQAKELLANPQAKAYIANLMQRTYK